MNNSGPIVASTNFTADFMVSNDAFQDAARTLAVGIHDKLYDAKNPFRAIIAITRGGMNPAQIVARELDIRVIDTLCIKSYGNFEQKGMEILKAPAAEFLGENSHGVLVIDDLVDTGGTLIRARESDLLPHATYGVVYAKPEGKPTVDIFVTEIPQETWIHFPWDVELARKKPLVGDDS